ncbi:hypothetical protein Q7P35_004734 [Cladosporium inversicolor]
MSPSASPSIMAPTMSPPRNHFPSTGLRPASSDQSTHSPPQPHRPVHGDQVRRHRSVRHHDLRHDEEDEEDEEDGMVLVDFAEEGRGAISSRDVECLDDDDSDFGTTVAEEIGVLVGKAIAEIKKWDREMGKRVDAVLSELQMLCGPSAL